MLGQVRRAANPGERAAAAAFLLVLALGATPVASRWLDSHREPPRARQTEVARVAPVRVACLTVGPAVVCPQRPRRSALGTRRSVLDASLPGPRAPDAR